jgi:hypothetical protein
MGLAGTRASVDVRFPSRKHASPSASLISDEPQMTKTQDWEWGGSGGLVILIVDRPITANRSGFLGREQAAGYR